MIITQYAQNKKASRKIMYKHDQHSDSVVSIVAFGNIYKAFIQYCVCVSFFLHSSTLIGYLAFYEFGPSMCVE